MSNKADRPVTRSDRPPVLLADASWYGTLAAVRDLGAHGAPVVLASDKTSAPARWSRFATRTVRCPSSKEPDRFLEWLLAFGEREPGHVYYPTSDSTAWLAAVHRDSLARHFKLFSPPASALSALLDKARLTAEARRAGLDVPDTWYPENEAELERLAGELPFPLVVKPRSQVFKASALKGDFIRRREDLLPSWRRFTSTGATISPHGVTETDLPLLQRFYRTSERIYTVDGFLDRTGELFATLGCTKLLQLPRSSGSGLVFEESSVHAGIDARLQQLLRSIGFFGVFDAEFLECGDRLLLIDINPRIYNHMDFEIKRGLPLAWLAYLGALDAQDMLDAAVKQAREVQGDSGRAYVHRLPTQILLFFQRLSGGMSAAEVREWRRWLAAHGGPENDPTQWPSDRGPAVGDAFYHLVQFVTHPRNFLRIYWRGVS
jgi:predicted ATP-grasp superfamily ATP-dependent carboligase